MIVGAGLGFPCTRGHAAAASVGNLARPAGQQMWVCFIWTAPELDQMLLCCPSLLVDLSR